MKKVLGILVLGLLWCNISFAEKINLVCEFQESLHLYKDGVKFGSFRRGDDGASPDKTIMIDTLSKKVKINDFEYDAELTENEINWERNAQGFSIDYSLNRLSGELKTSTLWPKASAMGITDEKHNCFKAEKKF